MTVYLCSNKDINEVNRHQPQAYNSFLKKLIADIWGNNLIKKVNISTLYAQI